MKLLGSSLLVSAVLLLSARADLTIVQKVEGLGPVSEMTIRIKGDKVKVDATPQVTSIIDGKTGEMLNLMNEQKKFMRISAEKAKAVTEMTQKFSESKQPAEKPKLTPTGKKQTINGNETEEYVCETPDFKARYWIATKYPEGATILRQLQAMNPEAWGTQTKGLPDYRSFPGVPIKTTVSMKGQEITTTLTSIKQDPIGAAEFSVPPGYTEMPMPDFMTAPPAAASPSPKP
jgi:hypothetical protein